jgi:hypothetical protein
MRNATRDVPFRVIRRAAVTHAHLALHALSGVAVLQASRFVVLFLEALSAVRPVQREVPPVERFCAVRPVSRQAPSMEWLERLCAVRLFFQWQEPSFSLESVAFQPSSNRPQSQGTEDVGKQPLTALSALGRIRPLDRDPLDVLGSRSASAISNSTSSAWVRPPSGEPVDRRRPRPVRALAAGRGYFAQTSRWP